MRKIAILAILILATFPGWAIRTGSFIRLEPSTDRVVSATGKALYISSSTDGLDLILAGDFVADGSATASILDATEKAYANILSVTSTAVIAATGTMNILSVTGDAIIGGTLTAGSISGAFVEADIDTEAELEATLTDVSNLFTNNDTVPDGNLASTIHRDTENKDVQYVGNAGNSVHLDEAGSSNSTSGASLIGVYDEFFAGNPTNVQDALDDIDARLYLADWVTADYLADTLTLDAILAINGYDVKIGSNLWVGNSGANGTIYFGDGNQSIIFDSGDNRFELNKSLYTGSSLLCSAPIYIGANDVVDDYLYIGGGYWKWDETYSQLVTATPVYMASTLSLANNFTISSSKKIIQAQNGDTGPFMVSGMLGDPVSPSPPSFDTSALGYSPSSGSTTSIFKLGPIPTTVHNSTVYIDAVNVICEGVDATDYMDQVRILTYDDYTGYTVISTYTTDFGGGGKESDNVISADISRATHQGALYIEFTMVEDTAFYLYDVVIQYHLE